MSEYDYMEAVKTDVREWMEDNGLFKTEGQYATKEDLAEYLDDALFCEDSVTGNGSGSYTFSTPKAEEYVKADGDDYIRDMVNEGWLTKEKLADYFINGDYESIDVCIRCYVLNQCIWDVINELPDNYFNPEETDDDTIQGVVA